MHKPALSFPYSRRRLSYLDRRLARRIIHERTSERTNERTNERSTNIHDDNRNRNSVKINRECPSRRRSSWTRGIIKARESRVASTLHHVNGNRVQRNRELIAGSCRFLSGKKRERGREKMLTCRATFKTHQSIKTTALRPEYLRLAVGHKVKKKKKRGRSGAAAARGCKSKDL